MDACGSLCPAHELRCVSLAGRGRIPTDGEVQQDRSSLRDWRERSLVVMAADASVMQGRQQLAA